MWRKIVEDKELSVVERTDRGAGELFVVRVCVIRNQKKIEIINQFLRIVIGLANVFLLRSVGRH